MIKNPVKRSLSEYSRQGEAQAGSSQSVVKAGALADSSSRSFKRRRCDEDESSDIEFISVPSTSSISSKRLTGKGEDKQCRLQSPEVIDLVTDDETDLEDHPIAGPSTLVHTQRHPVTLSLSDKDLQLAQKLQQELDDEDRRQREEDDKKSAEYIAWMDKTTKEMDAKRARLAQAFDGRDSGLVYQVVIDAEGRTLEGDEDADNLAHLEIVKRDFEQALNGGLKLKKVHWFVNQKLETRFENAKAHLASLGIDVTERNLFHGTAETNIQPILENGFKIGGVHKGLRAVNGTACGYGIYLATNSSTSVTYTAGTPRMFMCRVVVGRTTPVVDMKGPPKKLGLGPFEAYESAGVVVLKHAELCVPRYVVEFEPGVFAPQFAPFVSAPWAYGNMRPPIAAANFNGASFRPLNSRFRSNTAYLPTYPVPAAPTAAILQPLPLIQTIPAAVGNTVSTRHDSDNKSKRKGMAAELEDVARPPKRVRKVGTGQSTSARARKGSTAKGKERAREESICISD